jgi:hypothetical protein
MGQVSERPEGVAAGALRIWSQSGGVSPEMLKYPDSSRPRGG